MLGSKLDSKMYEKIVKGTALSSLSLEEIIDIAMNNEEVNIISSSGTGFWEYAGAYYRLDTKKQPTIVIDREMSVGGYNNSELTISVNGDSISSNDANLKRIICDKINERAQETAQEKQ